MEAASEADEGVAFRQLKTLVLNCTHLEWKAVQSCLEMLPKYVVMYYHPLHLQTLLLLIGTKQEIS